ncbi:MAG: hypothetical protein EAZ14_11390 [Runella slithyformis]|nr:MAG: hypothetical protein EAZ14_11390 [Runella slithyformis]
MSLPKRERFNQKLLLEGKDDVFVVSKIWETTKGEFSFDRIDCDGKDNIPDELRTYILSGNTQSIGIIIDADDNPAGRWQKYQDELRRLGYEVPKQPSKNGTIINGLGRNPRVGIWIMPNNDATGILESFIAYLIPENDPLWFESERILSEIEAKNLNKYALKDRPKALIHTWLAWQNNVGVNMSTAIAERYLTTDSDLCQRFVTWLDNLFNPTAINHQPPHYQTNT